MLPKENRLSSDYDYKRVQRLGNVYSCPLLVIQILKTGKPSLRFGIITSHKLDKKAVERNRIKRIIREVIRLNLERIGRGYEVVVIPKGRIKRAIFGEIQTDLIRLLKRGGML